MTDYYYQAVEDPGPPEDEVAPEAQPGREARRNVYPPEDEAYWAEADSSAAAEEPLWYEDRVDRGYPPPAPPEPPAPAPAPEEKPAAPRRRFFRRGESGAGKNPGYSSLADIAAEPASIPAAEPSARAKRWNVFRRGNTGAEESRLDAPSTGDAIAETAPLAPEPAAGPASRSIFRWSASNVAPDTAADVSWPDDTAEVPPPPPESPAPQTSRRVFRWASPSVEEDPEDELRRNAYWRAPDQRMPERENAAYPPVDDATASVDVGSVYYPQGDGAVDYDRGYATSGYEAEGWQSQASAPEPGRRAYRPGASAAAGAAAAVAAEESGEHRIRFDPTKERGAAYYDRAARHTRRVRFLRIALPAIAIAAVGLFFALMQFGADTSKAILSLSGINSDARSVTMDKPHISGFDGTKRAYEVNAVKAVQDLDNPKVMVFEQVKARFGMGDGVKASVDADTGTYDSGSSKLLLKGDVLLVTTNGYQAKLQVADIDVDKGTVLSSEPVEINGAQGTLNADTLELLDSGKHVFFRGNVKVIYYPPDKGDDAAGTSGADDAAAAGGAAVTDKASDGSVPATAPPASSTDPNSPSGTGTPAVAAETPGGST